MGPDLRVEILHILDHAIQRQRKPQPQRRLHGQMRPLGARDPSGPGRTSIARRHKGPLRQVDPVMRHMRGGGRPFRPPNLQLLGRSDGEQRPRRRTFPHRPMDRVKGRNVQRGHGRQPVHPRQPRRIPVKRIVVDHVEPAVQQRPRRVRKGRVQIVVQHPRLDILAPRIAAVVMFGQDRVDAERRIAVARGEQRHVMPARHQPLHQRPGMRLHPAHERLRDRVPDMRDDGDPHHSAAMAGCSSAFCPASSAAAFSSFNRRITLAVLA